MANTYSLIASTTVGSGGASSITFMSTGNIPNTYTDLLVKVSSRTTAGGNVGDNLFITFNGQTSRYYEILLYNINNAAGSASAQNTNAYLQWMGGTTGNNATSNTFGTAEFYIPNYLSSNGKSISSDYASESNQTNISMGLAAGLWNPTSNTAITSIKIEPRPDATSFTQYSTFYLYGIKNS